MNNKTLMKWAAVHSLGVLVYVFLVANVMTNADKIVGKTDNAFSGMAFLMMFVLSAAVVGSLIIGKPIFLYIDGKKKEAVNLLLYTILSLFILTALIFIIYGLAK